MHFADTGQPDPPDGFREFIEQTCFKLQLHGSHLLVGLIFYERFAKRAATGQCYKQAYVFCLMLAHKLLEDRTFDAKVWSREAKMTLDKINRMERYMLDAIGYDLFVSEQEIYTLFDTLDARFGWRQRITPARATEQQRPENFTL
jgi:hypothetical protein